MTTKATRLRGSRREGRGMVNRLGRDVDPALGWGTTGYSRVAQNGTTRSVMLLWRRCQAPQWKLARAAFRRSHRLFSAACRGVECQVKYAAGGGGWCRLAHIGADVAHRHDPCERYRLVCPPARSAQCAASLETRGPRDTKCSPGVRAKHRDHWGEVGKRALLPS